jgi:hypothetical protein
MSTTVMPLEGLAWQRWANELLIEHYGPTTYIKIPDTQGDGGIEGFTCPCGIAYQAYGAEKEKTGKALYEAQRDKMTRDINKFIDNAPLLKKLFGEVRIHKWILLVPKVGLKDLKSHAHEMTRKVKDAKLPYVADDFFVSYCDEDSFSKERDKILAYKKDCIAIQAPEPSRAVVDSWHDENDTLMTTLEEKLQRLEPNISAQRVAGHQKQMLSWYLQGNELMAKLKELSPTAYEKVFRSKSDYEQILLVHELTAPNASQQLKDVLTGFNKSLIEAVGSLSSSNAMTIACGAISDWMMRCPLDFREGQSNV